MNERMTPFDDEQKELRNKLTAKDFMALVLWKSQRIDCEQVGHVRPALYTFGRGRGRPGVSNFGGGNRPAKYLPAAGHGERAPAAGDVTCLNDFYLAPDENEVTVSAGRDRQKEPKEKNWKSDP